MCIRDSVNTERAALASYAAGLFDVEGQRTVYAKDIFSRRSPASITKVMTALVTLKYGNLDDVVTVTPIVRDIEYGSSVCDIKEGDVPVSYTHLNIDVVWPMAGGVIANLTEMELVLSHLLKDFAGVFLSLIHICSGDLSVRRRGRIRRRDHLCRS